MSDFDDHAPDGYHPYWDEPNTLDEQIREKILTILRNPTKGEWSRQTIAERTRLQKADELLALFTEHSKEVDRLARIDELSKIHTVFYDGNFSSIKDRLTQLKRNK